MLAEKYGKEIDALLARYPQKKSAVLHLMHLAQNEYGYMSEEAMREVADILDLDPTHVLSLAGFYSLFYEEPVGTYVLEVCNDLACALRGADEFVEMASRKLDIPVEGTTNDGLFTLKTVMCLGACDRAPMLQCNLKFYENLDETKFETLIADLRAKAAAGEKDQSVVERIIDYTTAEPPAAKPAASKKK
ncbi:MAG: NAD(P)H-dependent oxidoreductase subunit E [Chloroflexota bacterium]